jgi:hypothetical protein
MGDLGEDILQLCLHNTIDGQIKPIFSTYGMITMNGKLADIFQSWHDYCEWEISRYFPIMA